MTRFGQPISYGFVTTVLLHGQPVHLPYHRCFHRVFLPADSPSVVHPAKTEWRPGSVDTFLDSPAHIGAYPLGRPAAFGPSDASFDEQNELLIDIFISGDDRDTCVL